MEAGVCTDQETDGHSVTVSTALCLDSTALLLYYFGSIAEGDPANHFLVIVCTWQEPPQPGTKTAQMQTVRFQLALVSIIVTHLGQRFHYGVLVTLQSLGSSRFAFI